MLQDALRELQLDLLLMARARSTLAFAARRFLLSADSATRQRGSTEYASGDGRNRFETVVPKCVWENRGELIS